MRLNSGKLQDSWYKLVRQLEAIVWRKKPQVPVTEIKRQLLLRGPACVTPLTARKLDELVGSGTYISR